MLGLNVISQTLMMIIQLSMGHTPIPYYNQRLKPHDELFYKDVMLRGKVTVKAMLDSGSVACTLSSSVVPQLLQQAVLKTQVVVAQR